MRILRLTLALITISAAVAPAWGKAKPKGGAKGVAAGVNGEAVVTAPGDGARRLEGCRLAGTAGRRAAGSHHGAPTLPAPAAQQEVRARAAGCAGGQRG